ncbi:MAG: tetratricopeptide repeat protein [Candidatus Stygibacter frigidus]|nr:tetratricopeptide repeat protein [Candidatus Stygibacter frigidus]
MSHSSSITPADYKRIYAIRVFLILIWGGLLVFGIITLLQPAWLTDVSKMGKESEAMDIKKMGDNFMAKDEFNSAIASYQKALERNPELYEAGGNMAIAYSKLGNTDMAEKTLKNMINLIPERDYIGYMNLADIYLNKKDFQKAREYYQQSIKTNPFPAEAYKFAGFCSKQLGDLELALQYYNQAIAKITDFEQLYKGSLQRDRYRLKGSPDLAEDLEKLIKNEDKEVLQKYDEQILHYIQSHDPENAKIYNEMGVIFHNLGNVEMAKHAFQQAINIDPRNKKARDNLRLITQN